ncbi:MAG TPA: glucose-6-phosphate dehydrogenase assembly protein OpcA [Candidatus Binatia bacterium]|nr:glucose-6-phosphate dehydrogenase assembly protein OpcA [Candidatus Binatia bacterium]
MSATDVRGTPGSPGSPSQRSLPGRPALRWQSRAKSIPEIERELALIWTSMSQGIETAGRAAEGELEGEVERRVAARSSVMNLVVIAGRGEVGERVAAIVEGLTGRHPSRTIIVSTADPDGPSWINAQIEAHCVLPSPTSPETCSELVYLTCGGESGHHIAALVAPLLIHDLPVTVWWPGEPHFESKAAQELLPMADRVIVDGSGWRGDGLAGLAAMAKLPARFDLEVCDFALLRQVRWREAIASTFDRPNLLPFLGGLERIEVRYASRDGVPGMTNIVKPIYHVAWLASRLDMAVVAPLRVGTGAWSGYDAVLRHDRRRIPVSLRPIESGSPPGTTLAVELYARRARSELVLEVTAYADGVVVMASVDDERLPERRFMAPRRREADLLAMTIDSAGHDHVAAEVLAMAERLVGQ